jgi:hypothetical protein
MGGTMFGMQMAPSTPPHHPQQWGLIAITALLIAMGPMPAWASDRQDHERARQAVQAGQILPLGVVLERLARDQPGQVLEVELEHDKGSWVYEVKLLRTGGRVIKFNVDAATGEVLTQPARTNTKP